VPEIHSRGMNSHFVGSGWERGRGDWALRSLTSQIYLLVKK